MTKTGETCIIFIVGHITPKYVECRKTKLGKEYRGIQTVTLGGQTCQRWDMQTPQAHLNTDPALFGEVFLSDAWNYCRNPDFVADPWCYTTDPEVRYGMCGIPMCGKYITSY